jgi:hypothetical protein
MDSVTFHSLAPWSPRAHTALLHRLPTRSSVLRSRGTLGHP